MTIQLNAHDVLGKLSVVKNYLSVLRQDQTLTDSQKKLITPAYAAAQELIDMVKEKQTSNSSSKHVLVTT